MAVVVVIEDLPRARDAANAALRVAVPVARVDLAQPINYEACNQVVALQAACQSCRLVRRILSGLALYALVQLLCLEWIRAEHTVPEFAMIETLGLTPGSLVLLGFIEGTILAAFGESWAHSSELDWVSSSPQSSMRATRSSSASALPGRLRP